MIQTLPGGEKTLSCLTGRRRRNERGEMMEEIRRKCFLFGPILVIQSIYKLGENFTSHLVQYSKLVPSHY